MADDSQSLGYNPFEISETSNGVPDEVILHIMSFLGRRDLLSVALVHKRFNKMVTHSKETMRKIPLVLNFESDLDIADVINLADSRRFVKLILQGTYSIKETFDLSPQFMSLVTKLSNSVEQLKIYESHFKEQQFRWMMELFLPKLQKCELCCVEIRFEASTSNSEVELDHSRQHPLKTLELYATGDVTKFFSDCKQLKSLTFDEDSCTDGLVTFLNKQTSLENFDYSGSSLAWGRLSCKQLKKAHLSSLFAEDEILAAFDFLKELQHLEKLTVRIRKHPRRIVEAICKLKKLGDLTIEIDCEDDGDELPFERLKNSSVKHLIIKSSRPDKLTGQLLKVFHGVESIGLVTERLDLSNIPYETWEKIESIRNEWMKKTTVEFSPTIEPPDVARFESAVLRFVKKFRNRFNGITIGHENWLNNSNFSLTNGFCESLVTRLPKLKKLKLFNVADPRSFGSFLIGRQDKLQNIELFTPEENDNGPAPKKKKIQFN